MVGSHLEHQPDRGEFLNENLLQITASRSDVDVAAAVKALVALPGAVAIEGDPEPERVGSIFLPTDVGLDLTSDTGVVVAVGSDIAELNVGDRVIVHPVDGAWLRIETSTYRPNGFLRFYGHYGRPWYDSIVAVMESDAITVDTLRPVGTKVIIMREPAEQEVHGILLPDELKGRSGVATIVRAGAKCHAETLAMVGRKVLYSHEHVVQLSDGVNLIEDVGVIDQDYIWGALDGGQA